MKKETLEEAAERLYPIDISDHDSASMIEFDCNLQNRNAFIDGAKWQQEKSYSEEEVLHILDTFWDRLDIWYGAGVDAEFVLKEWFNKCELKKK